MDLPDSIHHYTADALGLKMSTPETETLEPTQVHAPERLPVRPSFFVVGPPRTGTSWLHEVLSEHTNLPAPTKETRFFDIHFNRGWAWYSARFPELREDRLTGEIGPTYFASAEARSRIAEVAPHSKIIIIFRHPVQRVVSLYRVKRAYGMLPWSLEEALDKDPELLESGRYASHLEQWQAMFPREQLLVTLYDDLRRSPQAFLDNVTGFLGIDRIDLGNDAERRVHSSERLTEPKNYLLTRGALAFADWCKAHNLDNVVSLVRESRLMKMFIGSGPEFPRLSAGAREKIRSAFIPEVEKLERMIGRDLSHWKAGETS